MLSRSWSLHSDESGVERPPLVTEPARRVGDDQLVLSAAELFETALGLTSWSLHSDESGVGRPPLVTEPVRPVGDDQLVLSAAELFETALGLTLTRLGIPVEGE